MRLIVFFTLALFSAVLGRAENKDRKASEFELRVLRANAAENYCAKIFVDNRNVFAPESNPGHGTGFIVELNAGHGLLFTNSHVIEKSKLEAQDLKIAFGALRGTGLRIPGRVVFQSPLLDFAIVEFRTDKLPRKGKELGVAKLPTAKEFSELVQRGRPTMAYGHPHDSENIATYGNINGMHEDTTYGEFIQVETPINLGNSGGPLVDVHSGKVLGINSELEEEAQNMGFAIPITEIIQEYRRWKRNPLYAMDRDALIRVEAEISSFVHREGLKPLIDKHFPNFLERYSYVLVVSEAHKSSKLEIDDIIMTVGGKTVSKPYQLHRAIHRSRGASVKMEVLRNGHVVPVRVPVIPNGFTALRQEVDYVGISGIIFQELSKKEAWGLAQDESRVIVNHVIPHSTGAMNELEVGDLLVKVRVGRRHYPVYRLSDLKKIVRRFKQGEPIRLVVRPKVTYTVGKGDEAEEEDVKDEFYDLTRIATEKSVHFLPVDLVLTPKNLSLRRLKQGFDFDGVDSLANYWWARIRTCPELIAKGQMLHQLYRQNPKDL